MERTRNETSRGTWGWVGLASYVVAFDILSEESLTHAFERGISNPRTRPIVIGLLGVTAAHLLQIIPEHLDPFDQAYKHFLEH